MIEIRCSALPRLLSCPGSLAPPQVALNRDDSAARLGTAVHAILADWIGHGYRVEAIEEQVRIAGGDVDHDEAASLARMGYRAWKQIEQYFPNPMLECELPALRWAGYELTGHCDLIDDLDGAVHICDWKSGRIDADAVQQLKGYGLLASQSKHPDTQIACAKVMIRAGTVEWYRWTRAELIEWRDDNLPMLGGNSPSYHPSADNCRYCPRSHECHAKDQLLAGVVRSFGDIALMDRFGHGDKLVRADAMAVVIETGRWLKKQVEEAVELVKAEVASSGGVMRLSDGRALALVPHEKRAIIEPAKAFAILDQYMSDTALAECVTLGKTKVEKAIKDAHAKGAKAAAVTEAFGKLEEAGCMQTKTSEWLEIVKQTKEIEE